MSIREELLLFEPVHLAAFFCHSLNVVTVLAQGLPIALVPEQLMVSSVRHDVIDDCCLGDSAFF